MNDFFKYYSKNNVITYKKYNEIDALYKLNADQLLNKYNDAFISLFKNSFNNSKFYNKLYKKHGVVISDIKDITDITKLPIIDRSSIKNNIESIYKGFNFLKVKGLTSGTSGTPLTVYRTPINIATEQAYIKYFRKSHGFTLGQPLLSIRGTLGKGTTHEFFKKANILYLSSPNINANTIDFYYKMIKEFGPVAIEAFPSYLYKLCTELEKKELKLEIPLTFTSSETLYEFQKEKIEPFLNTSIFDWYGNVERSIGIAQDKQKKYNPLPLYSINEFDKDKVITTALINKNFPLIRYVVEDRITLTSTDFVKNIISPEIVQIEGRAGDTLELKDGSLVGCIDHAFKGVENLDIAQVHQYNVENPLEVKLVVNEKFSGKDESQLTANFRRMIGENMEIKFTYCNREDLTYSGNQKYKLIIKKNPEQK